jgi:hypothetical protein
VVEHAIERAIVRQSVEERANRLFGFHEASTPRGEAVSLAHCAARPAQGCGPTLPENPAT